MTKLLLTALLGFSSLVTVAQAAPVVYFGENQTPGQVVSGAPLTARTSFLSNLTGVGVETFETRATGATAPLAISFPGSSGSITATLSGTGEVFQTPSSAGRFNTTGATAVPTSGKWWYGADSFSITFSTAISAFGFYGTDIGDFSGQVTVELTDINDIVTSLTIDNTVNGADASLLFWGFIDSSNSYKSLAFGNTAAGVDFFGFDDMVIGDQRQITNPRVPEPGTLALIGLGMAGLAFARKRKNA